MDEMESPWTGRSLARPCPFCGSPLPALRYGRGERERCDACRGWTFAGTEGSGAPPRPPRRGILGRLLGVLPFRKAPPAMGTFDGPSRPGLPPVLQLPLSDIRTGEVFPRRTIDLHRQRLLERSVARFGVLVPLVVHPVKGAFELVTGHRRLLAARRTGLLTVPAVVRRFSRRDAEMYRFLENSAVDPPGPLEEAEGFERIFLAEPGLDREDLCRLLGLDDAWLAERLELLSLPGIVQEALAKGLLDPSQARAVGGLESIEEMALWIERLSRGEVTTGDLAELLSRRSRSGTRALQGEDSPARLDRLEEALHEHQH